MSISGKQTINVGQPNQPVGSDSLLEAFNKIENNFTTLFSQSSPFVNFVAGNGVSVATDSSNGTVTVTNTGVTELIAGTNISLTSGNGNVTISAVPGGTIGTVSSIGISSNNLSVTGSPVTTSGTIAVNLPDNVTITGNLTVGGTILNPNLGDVSTVKLLGGTNGFVLQTDGTGNLTWTSLSVDAANVSGLGNISLLNIDGNSGNVLYGNGVFAEQLFGDGETIDITANGISVINLPESTPIGPVEQLSFNTSHLHQEDRVVGTLCWDPDDQTLNLTHPGDVTQQIGQELYGKVRNNTGNIIPVGTAVRFDGASDNGSARLEVAPFEADGTFPSLYGLGITAQDIDDDEDGRITVWGKVRDIDTTGQNGETWVVGDILYISPSVAGGLTKVKPTAPNNVIPIAAVLRVDATEGEIFVRPTIEQTMNYGRFERTTNLAVSTINTAAVIDFDTTEISNGVDRVVGNTSRLQVAQSGLYQVDVSAQVNATGGGFSSGTMYMWIRKNGVDVAGSTRRQGVLGAAPSASLGFTVVLSLDNSDYVEIGYAGDSTDLLFDAAAATAFAPATAAVKVGVTQIQL